MQIDGDMAELLGIHIGDGCISVNSRYQEYYLGGDLVEEREYHDYWVGPLFNKKVMIPLYGKNVNYKEHPKVGIYGFHIFDSKIVNFYNQFGIKSGSKINVQIPIEILKNSQLIKRFLRGLFDTDGSIYFNKNSNKINNRPRIGITTVSKGLALDVFHALKSLGFAPRMRKPYQGKKDKNITYSVLIYKIRDVNKFIEEIGFKNSKHYTKWQVYKKLGYCPSKTNIKERKHLLKNNKLYK